MDFKRNNRREVPRVMVNSFCPARIEEAGEDIDVSILNVSKFGVQLEAPGDTFPESFTNGKVLTLFVRTPFGPCRWNGEVRWITEKDGILRWGMRFDSDFARPSNPIAVMWKAAVEKETQFEAQRKAS